MAKRQPAVVAMDGEVLLEIPVTLELKGRMTGGVVYVDFNRPEYGKLECRYEQETDGALTLRDCHDEATRGDWVAADRMSVRLADSTTASPDMTVTACSTKTAVPRIPEDSPLPGFTYLPNGDVIPPPESEGVPFDSEPVEFGMTAELQEEYRVIAAANPAVKKLLGARFAYSYLDTIDPPKGQMPDSVHVKLWFFSHTHNQVVWVTMKNAVVEESGTSSAFLPEARAEVDAALALARKHPALAGRVNDLFGGGMVAIPKPDSTWIGTRVIEVHFGDASHTAKFRALVDLTNERVLEAGPVE